MALQESHFGLSPAQASYVLERAMKDRKLSMADVREYLRLLDEDIASLEERLAELRSLSGDGGEVPIPLVREAPLTKSRAKTGVSRRTSSAATAESRRLQGRFIAFLRQLPEGERAKYSAIAKSAGREKAIEAMQKARNART